MGLNSTGEVVAGRQLAINISGKVIHGDHYGRALGFPTANLDRRDYVRRSLKIKFGIWAGLAKSQNANHRTQIHRAAIVIGPVDNKGLPKIEAHLINFKGNLYGKKITISLEKFVRPFKKFKDEAGLKKQISKDINKIKQLGK